MYTFKIQIPIGIAFVEICRGNSDYENLPLHVL